MNEVLVNLLFNQAVRSGRSSWRWAQQSLTNPALKNATTARMFRADLVEEADGQMKLTASGRILAEKHLRSKK